MNQSENNYNQEDFMTKEVIDVLIDSYYEFKKTSIMKSKKTETKVFKTNVNFLDYVDSFNSIEMRLFIKAYFHHKEKNIRRKPNETNEEYFIRYRDAVIDKITINLKQSNFPFNRTIFFKSIKTLVSIGLLIKTTKQSLYLINPYLAPVLSPEDYDLFTMKIEDYIIDKNTNLIDIPQPL